MPNSLPEFLLLVSTDVVPILIVSVMMIAIFGCWRARRSWTAARVSDRSTTLSEIDAALRGAWDVFAEAAPGILVVLGLLGTFCGLAAAISDVRGLFARTDGSNPNALIERLMPILSGMGAKFMSSILGITTSLITRGFVSLLVTSRRRDVARDLLRRADVGRSTQQNNLLSVFTGIRDICNMAVQQTDELRAHLVTQKTTISQGIASRDELLRELASTTKDVCAHLAKHEALVGRGTADVMQGIARLGGLASDAISRADGLISRSDAIVAHLTEYKSALGNTYDKMAEIDAKIPTRQQATDSLELQKKVHEVLAKLLTSQQASANTLKNFGDASEALKRGADSVSGAAGEMAKNTDSLRGTIAEMKAAVGEMATQGILQMESGAKTLAGASEHLRDSIADSMNGFKKDVTTSLGQLNKDLTAATASISDSVAGSTSAVTGGIARMNETVGGLEKSITPALGQLRRSTDESVKAANILAGEIEVMRSIHASQDETTKQLVRHVETMAKETGGIAREVRAAERIRETDGTNVESAVHKLREEVVTGLNTIAESANAARTASSVDASANRLEGAILGLRDGTKPAVDLIAGSLERMQREVGDLARHADSIRGLAEAQHASSSRLADAMDRVDGSTSALAGDVRSAARRDVTEAIGRAHDALVHLESTVGPRLDELLQLSRGAPAAHADRMAASIVTPAESLATVIGSFRDVLATEFGATRAAVVDAVAELRAEGAAANWTPSEQQEYLRRSLETLEARLTALVHAPGISTTTVADSRSTLAEDGGQEMPVLSLDSAASGDEV